jgi:hypothetical protein
VVAVEEGPVLEQQRSESWTPEHLLLEYLLEPPSGW